MPRWVQAGSWIGLGLMALALAGVAYEWFWGPRESWRRGCHVCGVGQFCEVRLGMEWFGSPVPTATTEWLGSMVPEHSHIWQESDTCHLHSRSGVHSMLTACPTRYPVAERLWLADVVHEDPLARARAAEFLADVRAHGEEVAVSTWQSRIDDERASQGH